jgi:hypothetical protein
MPTSPQSRNLRRRRLVKDKRFRQVAPVIPAPRKKGRKAYADRYLSPRHRDNPGNGCSMAALGQEVARSTPDLKEAFERGLEEILSAQRGAIGRIPFSRQPHSSARLCLPAGCRTQILGRDSRECSPEDRLIVRRSFRGLKRAEQRRNQFRNRRVNMDRNGDRGVGLVLLGCNSE